MDRICGWIWGIWRLGWHLEFRSFYFGEYIYIFFINECTLYLQLKMNTNVGRLKIRKSSRRKVAGFGTRYRTPPSWRPGQHLFHKCTAVHVKRSERSVDWRSITESIYRLVGTYFKSQNSLTLTSEPLVEIITLRTHLLLCLMDWGVNDFCPACAYIHSELVSKP